MVERSSEAGIGATAPLQSDMDAPGPSSRVPLQSEVR